MFAAEIMIAFVLDIEIEDFVDCNIHKSLFGLLRNFVALAIDLLFERHVANQLLDLVAYD